ncbi:conserved hypothetical protein [uncultured spirochete]|uniref:Glycosyltransferase 2-like domain-containing protein n=1 Tax=uncultured spirochete TaxID=156406 RepID=A0A3P3XQ40_9SPIR|nr:conserved hypothetical protein [uncultured spirochete]
MTYYRKGSDMAQCMIIPTYWSTPDIPSWKIFDHPIPIGETGTLGRTLDNIESTGYPDPVIIFPAPTDSHIEAKVKEISRNRALDIHVFSDSDLISIRQRLRAVGFPAPLLGDISMDSYGGVRNMGLLYAALHGFDTVIMIDDDECIDPHYRDSALKFIGDSWEGKTVLGKTGCVVDSKGNKFYDGQKSDALRGWPKDELFNKEVVEALDKKDQLSESKIAFGGNMVLNSGLFLRVPFDPYGTRGEDDDYILNARYCGLPVFFDQELLLLHLPPERICNYWTRQRQDILHFRYMREKVRIFGFEPESLGGFLGYFTQDDLEYKAISSSIQAALHFIDTDRNEFTEFLNNAIAAETPPVVQLRSRVNAFLRFMDAWQSVLPKIAD